MQKKKCHITVLMIDGWPWHVLMAKAFLKQIEFGIQDMYVPLIRRIKNDPIFIEDVVCATIFKNKPHIIITIGERCSVATKKVIDHINGGFPVLFVGVRDPISHHLVQSLKHPNSSMSGVIRKPSPMLKVAHYFANFYPHVTSTIVLYSPDDIHLFNQATAIKNYLSTIGMTVSLLAISNDKNEALESIRNVLPTTQGLITLEGCLSNTMQEEIAYLCWQHEVVFCGSGPYAIDNGAACTLGEDFTSIAEALYKQLRTFWENGHRLNRLPIITLPNHETFTVNIDMLMRIRVAPETIVKICDEHTTTVVRTWTRPPLKNNNQ